MNVCTAFRLISELQSIGNKQIFHLLLRQIGFVRKHHKAKLTVFFASTEIPSTAKSVSIDRKSVV